MATYLVSYDLDKPRTLNDEKLENWLRDADAEQVLQTQWILKYYQDAAQLERIIMLQIDESRDAVLVLQIMPGFGFWNRLKISDGSSKAFINS